MKTILVYLSLLLGFLISCQSDRQQNLNRKASIEKNEVLLENPLLMTPMTSSIQPKDSTMSTLYGNEIASVYAKNNSDDKYPKGAVLYEVTWKQKPDELWFGANVPKEIFSVEKITFQRDKGYRYEIYKGNPLQKKNANDSKVALRISTIISQKMAVSP